MMQALKKTLIEALGRQQYGNLVTELEQVMGVPGNHFGMRVTTGLPNEKRVVVGLGPCGTREQTSP
jgi:hypothetical protein